jgi:hypothetical protein
MVTSAQAATNSSEEEKAKKIQTSPGFRDPWSGRRELRPSRRL